jgi:hypothetical protein
MLPSSRARWQVAVWDHIDKKLLHIVPGSQLCGGIVSEITGVASWRMPEASSFADCPHFVVSLDSLRTRAPARATRGAHALNSQALSSQASAWGSPISSGESEGPLSGGAGNHAANPAACLLVRVDHATGEALICRQLSLFDAPGGTLPSASDKDDETEQDWQCVPARCASVSCNARYISGGFSTGTVALWNASSARLVALLRDPRASGTGSAGSGGRGRQSMPGVRCVAMHPEQRVVAAARSDGWVDVWTV